MSRPKSVERRQRDEAETARTMFVVVAEFLGRVFGHFYMVFSVISHILSTILFVMIFMCFIVGRTDMLTSIQTKPVLPAWIASCVILVYMINQLDIPRFVTFDAYMRGVRRIAYGKEAVRA